jgi:hypothetical protein
MGVTLFKVKKWTKMLLGKSVYHVNQGLGRCYSVNRITGYYNDLTEKVTLFGMESSDVPTTLVDTGAKIYFSIAIFQYGLGAYDLYLLSDKKNASYLAKVYSCATWALENQQEDGSWVTFDYENPEYPFSAMAQGEAVSLLLRVYQETQDEKYLISANKALNFMLLPFEKCGPTKYDGEDVYLYECPKEPLILNGWIFSIWGLMDYCKMFPEAECKTVLEKTLVTLEKKLPDFDLPYWSMYEDGKRICSPFYHKLHIAQLNVMSELTRKQIYKDYADKWQRYQGNWIYRKWAFTKKASQKIFE